MFKNRITLSHDNLHLLVYILENLDNSKRVAKKFKINDLVKTIDSSDTGFVQDIAHTSYWESETNNGKTWQYLIDDCSGCYSWFKQHELKLIKR